MALSETERIEPDGERKLVTVLFADVRARWTWRSSRTPSSGAAIMQRFFSILSEAVHRYEGTVDKFTGDGIMAVFGAPVAHEDHANRACYAALRMLDDVSEYAAELRRKLGLNFSTRIGINSGEVIAGAIGDGGDGNYTAIGHTVGLAQRMEALAEPGKAYLAEAAAELARGFLDLEDLGEFEIKGSSRPVRVHELTGIGTARSRLDLSRERGFSRFVGRKSELGVLEEGLAAAQAGTRAVIGISAEAGLGKSRLTAEFAERCRADGIEVYEAQAQAHGQETPFAPVLQILRAYFGLSDSDSERVSREKIAGRALLLDPELIEDLPILFDFMGLADPDRPAPQLSPEARQRALRGLLCKLLHAPNRRDVSVSVIEDLHWMDEGSDALLGELLGSVEGTKTLVILNYRPEYSPRWEELPNYRQIPLEPLGHGRHRETAARPGRRGPLARRPRRPDPRADRRQPFLHRGDRPGTVGERLARGRSRRTAPGPARLRCQGPGQRPDRARGPDRQARGRREAARPVDVGRREGSHSAGTDAGLRIRRRGGLRGGPADGDRRRVPLRGGALPRACDRLPPPPDARGRLRVPARRPAGADPRRCGAGDDGPQPGPTRRARGV